MAGRDCHPKRVKAEAFLYAEGVPDEDDQTPPPSPELLDLHYIDRFGVMAVYGRPVLSVGEMRRMLTAENIKNAYLSRKASTNWGKWAQDHPAADELLKNVEMIIHANRTD